MIYSALDGLFCIVSFFFLELLIFQKFEINFFDSNFLQF